MQIINIIYLLTHFHHNSNHLVVPRKQRCIQSSTKSDATLTPMGTNTEVPLWRLLSVCLTKSWSLLNLQFVFSKEMCLELESYLPLTKHLSQELYPEWDMMLFMEDLTGASQTWIPALPSFNFRSLTQMGFPSKPFISSKNSFKNHLEQAFLYLMIFLKNKCQHIWVAFMLYTPLWIWGITYNQECLNIGKPSMFTIRQYVTLPDICP